MKLLGDDVYKKKSNRTEINRKSSSRDASTTSRGEKVAKHKSGRDPKSQYIRSESQECFTVLMSKFYPLGNRSIRHSASKQESPTVRVDQKVKNGRISANVL